MPAGARTEPDPEHLGVHVGVAIDKAWRDDEALGVNLLVTRSADGADSNDAATAHCNVGPTSRVPRAVNHCAAPNNYVHIGTSHPSRVKMMVEAAHPAAR
jgi:hypothetical protein